MEMPLISVIIPTYNREEMLRDALESLLCQETGGEFSYEIVVVDNASTDDSVAIVEAIQSEAGTGERIRLYRNPYNVGFAPNLDRAAALG